MIKTQLIIFHRPNNGLLVGTGTVDNTANYSLRTIGNPNATITNVLQKYVIPSAPQSGQGLSIDLYDDVPIPITFSILDIREPEKRKTSWSKTITIPGTKNNNRIFSHIYEIGQDGWITIGNTSVYEGFNPNLAKEVILLNDGVQVMKGNLQMKRIKRDKNGNIEYEVALNGDLTSLFYDIGTSKLSDLDFSEWDHAWSKTNIEYSWNGIVSNVKGLTNSIQNGPGKAISKLYRDATTGRLAVETSVPHLLNEDDFVFLDLATGTGYEALNAARGEFIVTARISSTKFVVNYFYPVLLMSSGSTITLPSNTSYSYKRTATGRGYVYPMISWGDEYDYNSFPVTSFVPGFYVKEIFDKIMKETKSSYESNFLNSQFFKRLFLIQKKSSYDLNPSSVQSRRFLVGTTQSYLTGASFRSVQNWNYPNFTYPSTTTTSLIFPSITAPNMPFKAEKGMGLTVSYYDYGLTSSTTYGNWDDSVYSWKVQDTGEYKLTANIRLSAWIDMNGFDGGPADGTASFVLNDPEYVYYTGPSYWAPSGPAGQNATGMAIKAKIMRRRNGFVSEIGTNTAVLTMNPNAAWPNASNWKYFGRYQPATWENLSLSITSTSTYFAQNDEVWIELSHYVQARAGSWSSGQGRTTGIAFYEWYNPPGSDDPPETYDINGEFYYRVEAGSFIVNDPSAKSVEGAVIQSSNILPKDMSCKDFLLAIIKSFNLHIEGDKQVERKYYIEPRDDYYKTGTGGLSDYVDWSDKIDETSVDIIPMGELIAKYYTFQNKPESDYWNKRFKEDRGRDYMSYTKEVQNDFLKNESKIEIPFGSTVMVNNPSDTDIVMPAILQKESNANKPVSNSLPRMLIYGGLRPYTAQRGGVLGKVSSAAGAAIGWELLSSSQSTISSASSSAYPQYPYAGTVDNPIDPVYDINWYNMEEGDFVYWDMARWTNENLYNKYWGNFIKEISDPASKVISADMRLTPKDIYDLDFRKIYVIDNNYLRLQKVIDYDPISDGLTRCEFLKLKSPSKFRRKSQIVDYLGMSDITFETTQITNGITTATVLEVAPAKRKADFGYTNTNSNSNLSNSASVMTNGLSNYVSSGVKNVKINGNENAIGTDVVNVNITSGDGNYVAGGVKNVNVIGTDKKYINESDVTYINGVRYKNGIAISKSNVINGGFNMAVIRSSDSTNVNVINASEDVVITSGTSNYENVINSGTDTILPDLKELGIASTLNPTPRTSLAGSYNLAVGTQSYVEYVRQAAANVSLPS